VIELKEKRVLSENSARKERQRLIKVKRLGAKRGYLVYVAREGEDKLLTGPKATGDRYYFEISAILSKHLSAAEMNNWNEQFRFWSKFRRG
jgi:hypothetical protein